MKSAGRACPRPFDGSFLPFLSRRKVYCRPAGRRRSYREAGQRCLFDAQGHLPRREGDPDVEDGTPAPTMIDDGSGLG